MEHLEIFTRKTDSKRIHKEPNLPRETHKLHVSSFCLFAFILKRIFSYFHWHRFEQYLT